MNIFSNTAKVLYLCNLIKKKGLLTQKIKYITKNKNYEILTIELRSFK